MNATMRTGRGSSTTFASELSVGCSARGCRTRALICHAATATARAHQAVAGFGVTTSSQATRRPSPLPVATSVPDPTTATVAAVENGGSPVTNQA
jgi:hypothetical protein